MVKILRHTAESAVGSSLILGEAVIFSLSHPVNEGKSLI
jgi:hypothetical protein